MVGSLLKVKLVGGMGVGAEVIGAGYMGLSR